MRLAILVINAILLVCASPGTAAVLGFDPSSASVSTGQNVTLNLIASALGGTVLGDFDIDIAFPAAKLTLLSFAPGDVLGDIPTIQALDFSLGEISPGLLNIAVVSLLSSAQLQSLQASPPLVLGTVTFTSALAAGEIGQVTIATVHALGDASGTAVTVDGLAQANLTGVGPTAIPEPATLLLSALGLVMVARRRR